MQLSTFASIVALFSASAFAELYYPPILSPKNGDVFVPGQNYTLTWFAAIFSSKTTTDKL